MKTINLLPKRTLMERFFILFLLMTVLIILTTSYYHYDLSKQQRVELDQKQQLKQSYDIRIQNLTADLQVDQKNTDYLNYKDRVAELKDSRIDWVPVFEVLTTSLKSPSRIISMESADKEILTIHFDFVEYDNMVDYLVLLEKSTLLEVVSPVNIEKDESLLDLKLEIKLATTSDVK